jgi:hypothetical protein
MKVHDPFRGHTPSPPHPTSYDFQTPAKNHRLCTGLGNDSEKYRAQKFDTIQHLTPAVVTQGPVVFVFDFQSRTWKASVKPPRAPFESNQEEVLDIMRETWEWMVSMGYGYVSVDSGGWLKYD